MSDRLLTEMERQGIVDNEYLKACEYSDKHEMSLSPKWWHPDRPADRKRYFNSQYQDTITEAIAKAQRDLTRREMVEWSDEICHEHRPYDQRRADCYECWQALKRKLVK